MQIILHYPFPNINITFIQSIKNLPINFYGILIISLKHKHYHAFFHPISKHFREGILVGAMEDETWQNIVSVLS